MSDARAPVAVVVVTWNSSRWIEACLGSLRRLDRPPAEVVVVDGASTDGTTELVKDAFPEVRVVECATNVGFCRANNIGISRTASPFVLALNPDTELEPLFKSAEGYIRMWERAERRARQIRPTRPATSR